MGQAWLLGFTFLYCLVSIVSLGKPFLSKTAFPKTWSKALKQKDNAWLIQFLKGKLQRSYRNQDFLQLLYDNFYTLKFLFGLEG